jgi:hypothetical protein
MPQELVDQINGNPNSPFKATLHPKFAEMTIRQPRRFLAPICRSLVRGAGHGSPRPVGADVKKYSGCDTNFIAGYYDSNGSHSWPGNYTYSVYDNREFCSSLAPAVTSAMSLALSVHHKQWKNLSVPFILDCDRIDDPCVYRPPLNAYEQFWRRYIALEGQWDRPLDRLRATHINMTNALCQDPRGSYPG